MKPIQHGTRSCYNLLKCRCKACKAANYAYLKTYMPDYIKRRRAQLKLAGDPKC